MTVITYLRPRHPKALSRLRTGPLRGERGAVILLCALACYVSAWGGVAAQGLFPRLENIGANKPVSASPPRATCGVPERSAYCQLPAAADGPLGCTQRFCIQDCPHGSSAPPYAGLLGTNPGACLTEDGLDVRPGADPASRSIIFRNRGECFASPPVPNPGPAGSFSLAVWLKPEAEETGVMTVLEWRARGRLVLVLCVSVQEVQLHYGLQNGQNRSLSINSSGRISPTHWTHLALQVHGTSVSLFLNGLEEDGTAFDTHSLVGPIADSTTEQAMRIGQSASGSNQFIGRMQDFRFYPKTLTNREIVEVFSGSLPHLHTQPACRCPPSHPRVHPLLERYCIPNGAPDTSPDRLLRLHPDAHPLHYVNDNDMGTAWLSSVFSTPEQLEQGLTLTFDLQSGQYQVFYVILQFVGPQPTAVRIQRRARESEEWRDWQLLARDCSVFGLENDGLLEQPDSVNCLQFHGEVPYSRGNITLSMLAPEPNPRPGYNDFYNSPVLQEFVRASQVRVQLHGQYHTQSPDVPFRHRYYALAEVTISGRCQCHGHASICDTSQSPYRCACVPESHTLGHNCERCATLFNDKPFRPGDQLHAYNCRPCRCHAHATSCHYDITVDPYPGDHFQGGGGVCDNCTHNTTGRHCERCVSLFFREAGATLWAEDVCKPCDCHSPGTINSSLECDEIGGQCKCKRHVSGRQCNQCQHGFYKLQASRHHGCSPCSCNPAGTVQADITCHQDSGQCQCKPNVIGRTCDRCDYGFKLLRGEIPEGCVACDCDPRGSKDGFCNPSTGQCECEEHVQGLQCQTCATGFYGLHHNGSCRPCDCSATGTVPGSACDPVTGRCSCKMNVEGLRCDSCKDGYHSLDRANALGCLACPCHPAGTVGDSNACSKATAECVCKAGVEGPRCDRCMPHTYKLSAGNATHACVPCDCDPIGTVPASACDPTDGQCVCLPTHQGRDCSTCKRGLFLSMVDQTRCVPCDCHPVGAVDQTCATDTGQCACAHPSLTGRRCDQCKQLFYGFNPGTGRCVECVCDAVGSVNGSCHPDTGHCACKQFVTGERCGSCAEGAGHMDPDNYLGCSKAPSQQPPPQGSVLGPGAIRLGWAAPDSPNSNALAYTLLRGARTIHTAQSYHPFESMMHTDSGLSPYTVYSYQLVTSNVQGSTSSAVVSFLTLASVPDQHDLQLTLLDHAGPDSAAFNWTGPLNTSGPVERFVLSSVDEWSGEERVHYTGTGAEATASGLRPFARYNFTLQACTSGGCAHTAPVTVVTAQIPPQDQPLPWITTLGPTKLRLEWGPPARPNGIIIRYEVFMQGPREFTENVTNPSPERRVFLSSGWLDPLSVTDPSNESALSPPVSSAVVSDLEPFSSYRFRVLSVNMAGSALSDWATGHTAEEAPRFMAPPQVSAVSPTALKVTWATPQVRNIRGKVTQYRVNLQQEQTSNPYAPPLITQVLHSASAEERSYTVKGLRPYQLYNFTLSVCNTQGCITSLPASARTLPTAPAGLSPPKLEPLNMTAMTVWWPPPAEPNGPPPLYQLERTDVSLSDGEERVVRGTRFTGSGYFRFTSTMLPADSDFTGVQLSFRTRAAEGLILCALSPGEQEEYVALQMHGGRPFFVFDPQGSAVALSPENDGGRRYDDGQWHRVLASRKRAVGTIIVDGRYRGSASAVSGRTIIGQNTGVFMGGLPEDFTLLRNDTGPARLVRQGFSGCVRDVLLQRVDGLAPVWEPLDWTSALDQEETYQSWEGCPLQTQDGAHFLGQGFLRLRAEAFSGGEQFEVAFEFRTDQLNALLLFAFDTEGEDYLLAELQGGLLTWALRWGQQEVQVGVWAGLSYCDGGWNSLSLLKRGALVRASLNQAEEQERARRSGPLRITSPLYLGGVPAGLAHPALIKHSLLHGFGGCIRAVSLPRGTVSLAAVAGRAVRVNLDGCLSAVDGVNCRGNDSILVYAGRERTTLDLTLQPFTEYLYRVMAQGEGGWTAGPWQRGRSRETAGAGSSRVVCVNGSSMEVDWEEPSEVRGVIEKYIVKVYKRADPSSSPISATFSHTHNLTGILSGLSPFSSYGISLTACTQAGCTEGPHRRVSTPQEAPEGVSPPLAIAYPNSLFISWDSPHAPNGIITEYTLYKDNSIMYQGNGTELNITGLAVYSPHRLLLGACTEAGCSNSSQITVFTGQLPPSHMDPPILTVLDARTVHIQWAAPEEVNGVLEFYAIYQSILPDQLQPTAVYNSSELFEDHTLRNLVPGTTYSFQIAACSGGGCALSDPSLAQTSESTPEEVPPPHILPLSPYSLNVSWAPPGKPNGVIASYGLWMNGVLVQNSSSMHYEATGLSPWSLHGFWVQACTAEGCAMGWRREGRTLETAPEGHVALELLPEGPRSVRAKWHAPAKPNGNLTYSLIFTSTALGSGIPQEEAPRREDYPSGVAGRWVSVADLLPYSNYSTVLQACNSQGCVASPPGRILLPPTAPDGVLPPRLAAATPSSLRLWWSAPARPNAPGPLRYRLLMKTAEEQHAQLLMDSESTVFTYTVEGLRPHTEYLFSLIVSHKYGQTSSAWALLDTAQDRPAHVDLPMVSSHQARSASVSWHPPSQPNGLLTRYNVYLSGRLHATLPGNVTHYTASQLEPYQNYTLQLEACTEAGCTLSGQSRPFRTPPAPPEGVAAPQLFSDTPTSVLLRWEEPERPNGQLESYVLERRASGTREVSTVAVVGPGEPRSFLDGSAALSPWSSYEYRVVASTLQAGSNSSRWAGVTTKPSRPAGLLPPQLLALGPDAVQVTWSAPLIANGEIERYEIRMPDPRISLANTSELNYTVAGLLPYTNYSVTILACAGGSGHVGGCTESLPAIVTTFPTIPQDLAPLSIVAVSESFLAVSWQPPARPNGPNVRYELLRRKSRQPLAPRPPEDLDRWYNVYAGTKLFHQDKGLSRFTWYQYQLLVHNEVGYAAGEVSTGVTLAGRPLVPSALSALALNHTAVYTNWSTPSLEDLQGEVELYTLWVNSTQRNQSLTFAPGLTSAVISDLQPSTEYRLSLLVSNGAHNISSEVASCTTTDGEPQGVFPPEVVTLNSTAVRVLWSDPAVPNGAVTQYSVYMDQKLCHTASNSTHSLELSGLLPFTVYSIQVEVCTVYACVKSNGTQVTTVEDTPAGLAPPNVHALTSRSVRLDWVSPGRPNGILQGFEVWRRTLRSCAELQLQEEARGQRHCAYLQCPVQQDFCHNACYQPGLQVCCGGAVHSRKHSHQCCDEQYLPLGDASERVCCGGRFLQPLPQHQCCGNYYVPVSAGEVCCADPAQRHVSVGLGDSCCGGAPYSSTAGQLCCGGVLHDGFASQCCGGRPVGRELVCCGDGDSGKAYTRSPGMSCCGDDYINSSTALCCGGHLQRPKVHHVEDVGRGRQCCGSEVISNEQECCNGVGYDPLKFVCADRAWPDPPTLERCLPSTVCPVSAASGAFCGSCDFNPQKHICTWIPSGAAHPASTQIPSSSTQRPSTQTHTTQALPPSGQTSTFSGQSLSKQTLPPSTQTQSLSPTHTSTLSIQTLAKQMPTPSAPTPVSAPSLLLPSSQMPPVAPAGDAPCPSSEELVYRGAAHRYTFTDAALEPYSSYEYRLAAWNSHGRALSAFTAVTTKEDLPGGVASPRWKRLGHRDDIIQLDWRPPLKPNGDILHYVMLRNGQERYRGTETSFTDAGGIRPFQEYVYQLQVCTTAGCTNSPEVVAATVQGPPERVAPPTVSPAGPRSLQLSWTDPARPNGVVREYRLNESRLGLIYTDRSGAMQHTVTGLQPHTNYSFQLIACTAAGCGASQPSMGRTLQDAPAGVWATPRYVPVNASAVELYWSEPRQPNGLLTRYQLLRDGTAVFTSGPRNTSYTDSSLRPNSRYVYELEASTGGGSSRSSSYVVQTPVSCPERIPPPHSVAVTGPHSVSVAWQPPGVFNASLGLEYNVLLNAGSERPLVRPAGPELSLHLQDLTPHTEYHIRIQACQPDGCGVGPGVLVRTAEAPPEDLAPPQLDAVAATIIEARWNPPGQLNGVITSYFIHRRPMGTQEELLVFIWSQGPLEFIDASDSLLPFTEYEYRVSAHNSQGSASSPWTATRTAEAEPRGMAPPTVWPSSAYSMRLNWSQPRLPNGVISQYKVVYQKELSDPTLHAASVTALTVPGNTLQALVFGLEPFSSYSVCVEAVNGAGRVSSPWVSVRTLEAFPGSLANFSVERREQGRALLLHWPEPASPNGIIKVYNIYSENNLEFSGLSRHFLFRRLEPYTIYSLVLEACTAAGCTRTAPQVVMTDEAPPTSLAAPTTLHVSSQSVELAWAPPVNANGKLHQYQILALGPEDGTAQSKEEDSERAMIVFTKNDTQAGSFSHMISDLQPWSKYRFRVRVSNGAGHADSPWLTVHTKQAPPRGLAAPVVSHIDGRPYDLFLSWAPPLETNGILLSYKVQRDNVGFQFSFDPGVLSYTDEGLMAYTTYSYAVTACTMEGCVTSPSTEIRTLEAAPATVEPPTMTNITSDSLNVSWTAPSIQNGEITRYNLLMNGEELYRGKRLWAEATELQPHTRYELALTACTHGGCTTSTPTATQTLEAPPIGLAAPILKVTGAESVEVTWREPELPNGVVRGYELRRDGQLIYAGTDTRYHDFTLLPSMQYSYTVTANNSRGSATSAPALTTTHSSAPSGVAPPTLQPLGPTSIMVQWEVPARANGELVGYSLYQRDPAEPNVHRLVFSPQHSAFQSRTYALTALRPYYRYELRVEACTMLGCAASDWASVQTLEAPPAGQPAPLLELQPNSKGLQTVFLLSWAPPAQTNGKLLHYELYRRRAEDATESSGVTQLHRNLSSSYHDAELQPYTSYEYQVWAVNSAGRAGSPWAQGRTGPAPPEGVSPPKVLRAHATSAVVDISPPSQPNGIVSLYRVLAQSKDSQLLVSEGTSVQQTLHGLQPFTLYSVWVEACTCFLCCSRGPVSELRTQASAPAQQPPPQAGSVSSRSALVEWEQPLRPNGLIESYEVRVRRACPQPLQPVSGPCTPGPVETRFFGKAQSFNLTGLLPYVSYELQVLAYNNMGSTASDWVSLTTLTEPPQYKEPFAVRSNLTWLLVDWTQSFALNGHLRDYVLTENSLRLYSGFHSSLYIPRTSDKTFAFQVTCTTDGGSASSPVIRYSSAAGVAPVEPTSGDQSGLSGSGIHTELWFILLMALLGLLLLALLLGLLLRRALSKPPLIRERPPLVPLQKRSPKYPPGDSYLFENVPETVESCSVTLKGFTRHTEGLTDTKIEGGTSCVSNHSYQATMSVMRIPSQCQIGHAYSQNSLHRSISQLIDTHDKKCLMDGTWDSEAHGTDSGMFVGDEEIMDNLKGFSTVRKEHTMFTDTHL